MPTCARQCARAVAVAEAVPRPIPALPLEACSAVGNAFMPRGVTACWETMLGQLAPWVPGRLPVGGGIKPESQRRGRSWLGKKRAGGRYMNSQEGRKRKRAALAVGQKRSEGSGRG